MAQFEQHNAAEPMDERPQYGPVTEPYVTAAIGEPGGPIADMRRLSCVPPQTLAVCVGYWYECGCEIRGSAPFYGWQMCKSHERHAREWSKVEIPVQYASGMRMTWEQAKQQLGWGPESPPPSAD